MKVEYSEHVNNFLDRSRKVRLFAISMLLLAPRICSLYLFFMHVFFLALLMFFKMHSSIISPHSPPKRQSNVQTRNEKIVGADCSKYLAKTPPYQPRERI